MDTFLERFLTSLQAATDTETSATPSMRGQGLDRWRAVLKTEHQANRTEDEVHNNPSCPVTV